jgi:hypothetical protein
MGRLSKSKKIKQGGKREGAGRPKIKEDTVVMRVPKSLVEKVKHLIDEHSARMEGANVKVNNCRTKSELFGKVIKL